MAQAMWRVWCGVALSVAATSVGCASMGQAPAGEDALRLERSPRFHNGVFINDAAPPEQERGDLLVRLFQAERVEPQGAIPLGAYAPDARQDGLQVTWVGHSTVLVELDGVRILTDPVWSERVSPVDFMGPIRFHDPGIDFDALPPVDVVVISHDHYDHLDMTTAIRLAAQGTRFVVPLGVGSHLRAWSILSVTELDWWERVTVRAPSGHEVALIATPAQHFSGRNGLDRNATLWASWAFVGPRHRVYFGGDTGYNPAFATIGEALGPFDLTLMPIGAYDKAWPYVHLDPEEAVQAHVDVRGAAMLPIHWGTFTLALHDWDEPIERLLREAEERAVTVLAPRPGEPLQVERPLVARVSPWWRAVDGAAAETGPVSSR